MVCGSLREADRCHGTLVELLAAVGLHLKGTDRAEGGIFDLEPVIDLNRSGKLRCRYEHDTEVVPE